MADEATGLKGYNILSAVEYLKQTYSPEQYERALATLSEDVRDALPGVKQFEFYPRRYFGEIVAATAGLHEEEDDRHAALASLGENIARGATNTFLRLLMRMMTPRIFANKAQTIWSKDHRGGIIEADTSKLDQNEMVVTIGELEGFKHMNAISLGWMRFGFTAMGCKNVRAELVEGGLEQISPPKIAIRVNWD